MNRCIAVLLVLASLVLPAQIAMATSPEAGEGYARPTYIELIQTLTMMGGADITNNKIADEYGKIVYCDLYRKNFKNDVIWEKYRSQIVARMLKKKEYYRIKYEVVGVFYLGRYDFKNQYFPISNKAPIKNVGSVSLSSITDSSTTDCAGQGVYSSIYPVDIVMKLNEPLTIQGFKLPNEKVEKLMVRLEEAGDTDRRVYGRIRMIATDAKGIDSKNNSPQAVLNGKVTFVDFFIDQELTKPIASIKVNKE